MALSTVRVRGHEEQTHGRSGKIILFVGSTLVAFGETILEEIIEAGGDLVLISFIGHL